MKRSNLVASTMILLVAMFLIIGVSSCKKDTVEPEPPAPVINMADFAPYQGEWKIIASYDQDGRKTYTSSSWNIKIIIKDNIYKRYNMNYYPPYLIDSRTIEQKNGKFYIYGDLSLEKWYYNNELCLTIVDKLGYYRMYIKY